VVCLVPEVTLSLPASLTVSSQPDLASFSGKFKVLSTVADGRSFVDATQRLRPDLVLAEGANHPVQGGGRAVLCGLPPWGADSLGSKRRLTDAC